MATADCHARKAARGECRECSRKARRGRVCWRCRRREAARKRREYWAKLLEGLCVEPGCVRRPTSGCRCEVCREVHNAVRRAKRRVAARPPKGGQEP